MRCKHNRLECIKDELFCIHCGMLIIKNKSLTGDNLCKIENMDKDYVKTIMEVGVLEESQTEENIFHVCRKHVLDLSHDIPGDNMKNPKCKMSIIIDWYSEKDRYCAIHKLVKCEGVREDSNNCPYWKRASE